MRLLGRTRSLLVPLLALALTVSVTAPGTPVSAARAAVCQLGESQAGATTLYNVFVPGTKFYALLEPSACTACPTPPGVTLTAAGLRLKFNTACSLSLRVSVVGWLGTASCPRPNAAQVLCGPVEQIVADVAGEPGAYTVPLPPGCCIQQKAYLCLEVLDGPANALDLGFGTAGTGCVACVQRWEGGILPPGTWDLCDASYGLGQNVVLWADAGCCDVTPAERHSWGRLKVTYR